MIQSSNLTQIIQQNTCQFSKHCLPGLGKLLSELETEQQLPILSTTTPFAGSLVPDEASQKPKFGNFLQTSLVSNFSSFQNPKSSPAKESEEQIKKKNKRIHLTSQQVANLNEKVSEFVVKMVNDPQPMQAKTRETIKNEEKVFFLHVFPIFRTFLD